MKATKTIVAITTLIAGAKNYVAAEIGTRSYDRMKLVDHTREAEGAKDFGTLEAARQFIAAMANPHNRIYTAEKEVIKMKAGASQKATAEKFQ